FDLTGTVPQIKQQIEYGPYKLIIEKVDRNRIIEVLLIKENAAASDTGK
ncbi:MAG TPA: hypothetical protein ENN22_10390, partial [bacterium]|nr:hypothetical protein [bacterium]